MEEKTTLTDFRDKEKEFFAGKYEIVGEGDFATAKRKLLKLSRPQRIGGSSEVLYKLNSAPQYGEITSLVDTMDLDIEIGVLFDGEDWFLVRGFAGSGKDLTGRFIKTVPEKAIFLHTHPLDKESFTNPSIFDVAYSTKKRTTYIVIGGLGLTEYTGVKRIKDFPNPPDPDSLIEVMRDDYWDASIEEQQRAFKEMGMETRRIPWGEEAKKYWDDLKKGINLTFS